jgi:RHS repeat-associated protein
MSAMQGQAGEGRRTGRAAEAGCAAAARSGTWQLHAVLLAVALVATAPAARAQNPPEEIEYYATDALGSVRIVFTPAGQVLGRSDYLPFGGTLNQSGALPRQRFTGQERDGEAGLDYFHARSLQARTGRMNAPDPVWGNVLFKPQRWNRYAYALNNPLRMTDPSGMEPEEGTFYSWTVGGYGETAPLKLKTTCASCAPPPEQMSEAAMEGSTDLIVGGMNATFGGDFAAAGVMPGQQFRPPLVAAETPALPPPPRLPKGDPVKPVNAEEVKRQVAGPGCQMVEMQVTGYYDGNPKTADNTPTREGVMATALFKPQPYPFGTKADVLDSQHNVLYAGTIHDLGLGWDSKHHNIRPEEFLDVYKPSAAQANQVGNWWRLVRICPPR